MPCYEALQHVLSYIVTAGVRVTSNDVMVNCSCQALLDTFFAALPGYGGMQLEALRFQRVLFGGFPCYRDGPLRPGFDRIIQVTWGLDVL